MVAILFIFLVLFLVGTAPIFIALSGSTAIAYAFFSDMDLVLILQRSFAGVNKLSLISIPMFIFAANIMSEGGLSRRIIDLANAFVGHIPGGLGMTVILASLFFGAISGSAPATVVAIGGLLYPALLEKGYSKEYSAGVVTAAGSLGVIIPPSVTMIVYGVVTGASVGALFMAGFGAGIIYALIYMIYTYIMAKRSPNVEKAKKASWRERGRAFVKSAWAIGVPVIILGGIYSGFFTPAEASCVAVVYSMIVALFIYREMNLKQLIDCARKSALTTIQVMSLLAAASVFAYVLTEQGVTVKLAEAVLSVSSNKYVILLMMNIVLLICGMFLDGCSIITILGPLFYPIALQAGIDPIHLGIVIVVNTAIGMFTPPFGLNLFVASTITKQPILKVSKGVLPFIIISVIALLIITYIPDISLFIPRLVYKSW